MIANIIATIILASCVICAVGYIVKKNRQSAKSGNPACCGCSSAHCCGKIAGEPIKPCGKAEVK
jgi:hypothetical protein